MMADVDFARTFSASSDAEQNEHLQMNSIC